MVAWPSSSSSSSLLRGASSSACCRDLAARVASQVIKAYVDKQRAVRNNPTLFSDKADPGSVPMAALWSAGRADESHAEDNAEDGDHIHGGTMLVKLGPAKTWKAPHTVAVGAVGTD